MKIALPYPRLVRYCSAPVLLAGACAVAALLLAGQYLRLTSPLFLFGLGAACMVTFGSRQSETSARYAYVSVVFSLLTVMLPLKSLLFASLACALLFVVETTRGKTDGLPLMILLLLSPASQFLSDLFTFPLRLELSSWAGKMLQLADASIRTEGNMIISGQQEYSVDPACMGMNMMLTSLITGVVFISVSKQRSGLGVRYPLSVALLMGMALLNTGSNLVRIILLVHFDFREGTFLHDLTGLLCFAAYVMLPGAFLCRWAIARLGRPRTAIPEKPAPIKRTHPLFNIMVAACLLCSALVVFSRQKAEEKTGVPVLIPGYRSEAVDAHITKLQNDRSLVYLKKIPGFWTADHNPMICWRGSGYTFTHIKEITVCNTPVYSAVLSKGTEQLHTIWWYANGKQNTDRQLAWRWDMLRGAPAYAIVNITCLEEGEARQEAENALRQNHFRQLLQ